MISVLRRALSLALLGFTPLLHAQSTVDTVNLTFTTIDVPGAADTNVLGINTAGDVVGDYASSDIAPPHGFKFSGGIFTLFDYPGQYWTVPFGINDAGLISGSAYAIDGTSGVGFLYDGTAFTTLQAQGKSATLPRGINNAGTVVGGYGKSLSSTRGFALVGTKFKTVSPPGVYTFVFGDGINNRNQVVGTADQGGFFSSNGTFKTIAVPGASETQPFGINDNGVVVGWYFGCAPSCTSHGFVFLRGRYLSFDYPGAMSTFADGINNSGEIVGSYTFDNQTFHGYITNPTDMDQALRDK